MPYSGLSHRSADAPRQRMAPKPHRRIDAVALGTKTSTRNQRDTPRAVEHRLPYSHGLTLYCDHEEHGAPLSA